MEAGKERLTRDTVRDATRQERSNVITRVEETRWGKRKLLTQLQVPKSNYYRWRPVNNT